jgi:flagellar basal-body rod protein FlgC
MNLFGVMDISASALQAERVRAEIVASNMANAETTRTADGTPYQRHHVVFESQDASTFGQALLSQANPAQAGFSQFNLAGQGIASGLPPGFGSTSVFGGTPGVEGGVAIGGVIEDTSNPLRRYDPQHPDADANGYVAYPDINPLTEMVDLMGATRGYGMNASAVQAEKNMLNASLDILK